MPVRRAADPSNVQHVWNAIRSANAQKEIPDVRSILDFFQNIGITTQSRVELYINQTLQDGLIISLTKNGGNMSVTDSYRIPMEELTTPEDDGKDWYCIECHLGGDVTLCKLCHRVFHVECSKNATNKQVIFQSIKNLCSSSSKQSLQGTYNERLNDNENIIDISNDDFTDKLDMSSFDDIEKQLSNLENPVNNTQRKTLNSRNIITDNDYGYDVSICNVCNLSRAENNFDLEKEELNYLLGFILDRIRSWLPTNLTHTMAPDNKYEWLTEKELSWRSTQLFYQHMDMIVMELKLQSQEYTRLYEFLADVLTIQHNVAVFHGIESQEYGAADLMLRDCVYDLKELIVCPDCYRHSNEKANNRWFCLPCRKPHRLVWAKQKGYPYWPAKVIKETDTNYDVRFFGGKYERSVLQKSLIKPIESSMKSLQIKRSGAFNRALEELRFHQKLLGNPNELAKLVTSSKAQTPHFLKSKKHYAMNNIEDFPQKNISIKKSFDLTQDLCELGGSTHQIENRRTSGARSSKRKNSSLISTDGSKRRSSSSTMVLPSDEQENFDVIPISDGEDDCAFSIRDNRYAFMKGNDSGFEQVSSSTEYITSTDDGFSSRDNIDNVMHELEQPYSDSVEKMRRKLEQTKDKNHLIKTSMDCMQMEIDRITNEHNDHLKKLFDAHNSQVSETKKKQWCYNCEQDAIYHCCWNTAYCSPTCQQQHWQAEHKKVCRRKR